jgi:signal transduction histidine kinase
MTTMPTQPEDVLTLEYELISCELHDGPCQYIASAQMILESLRHQGAADASDNDHRLDMTLGLLQRAEMELRRVIRGIHPLELNDTRKAVIVERLREENQIAGGPKIEWCLDIEFDKLPSNLRATVLRILQECLTNVRRHSMADKVLIGVTQDDTSVSIQVQDWGIGFDLEAARPKCSGLNGIRQRARLLNGTVNIDTCPGGGTCIVVDLPLQTQINPEQQQT